MHDSARHPSVGLVRDAYIYACRMLFYVATLRAVRCMISALLVAMLSVAMLPVACCLLHPILCACRPLHPIRVARCALQVGAPLQVAE